jgi:hypothetical protein
MSGILVRDHDARQLMTAIRADKYLFHQLEGAIGRLDSLQSKFTTASVTARGGRGLHQRTHLISLSSVRGQSESHDVAKVGPRSALRPQRPSRQSGCRVSQLLDANQAPLFWRAQAAQQPAFYDCGLHRVGKLGNGLEKLRPFKAANIRVRRDRDRYSGCTVWLAHTLE